MGLVKRKKCQHCQQLFIPDPRNAKRQQYCRKPACRKASKAASQKKWLHKPANRNYFQGPTNVHRVQQWRKANPGYSRRKPTLTKNALQDSLIQQSIDLNDNTDEFTSTALQDLLTLQPSVLIGLIAQLTGFALQDDIALAAPSYATIGQRHP